MKKSLEEKNGVYHCSDKNTFFIVHIVEIIHEETKKPLKEIYKLLKETKVYDYIVKNYEALHTQDIKWVARDSIAFMKERGAVI